MKPNTNWLSSLLPAIGVALGGCSGSGSSGGDAARPPAVVINELFPGGSSSAADPDWAELKNVTDADVDVSGYRVRDKSASHLFELPAGTSIAAGGYLLIFCDDGGGDGGASDGLHAPWKLSASKADEFHLLDPSGAEVDTTKLPVDLSGDKAWGRLPDGTGSFARVTPTRGEPNL